MKTSDPLITIDDIKGLPGDMFPMLALTNGYTSIFGFLISLTTHDFWNHFMWLINPREFATQWWWFCRKSIDDFRSHSIKLFYNPDWTDADKLVILKAIDMELERSKWDTHYDVWGLIQKACGKPSPNNQDFCSEKIDILSLIDDGCKEWLGSNCSPSPEEVNGWLKGQDRFRVFGRVQPG